MRPKLFYDEQSYEALVWGWKSVKRSYENLGLCELPCGGVERSLLCIDIGDETAPAIHVAAGVHGDEPAAPWALLSIVEAGLLDPRFSYRLWPCTNPSGYVAGTRSNAEGRDINRSFSRGGTTPESRVIVGANRGRKFVLALDLHEDFEADGFYCYEPVIDGKAPLSEAILGAIESAGFPLQTLDHLFDLGYPVDPEKAAAMRTLEPGRVLVNANVERRVFPGIPLSLFLLRTATRRYVTLETPRTRRWNERIAMHRVAVATALAEAARLDAK